GGERFGRTIRRMRVVEMHPQKSWLARIRTPPSRRGFEHGTSRTFLIAEIERRRTLAVVVVVDVEAGIESVTRIERIRTDERAGGVAGAMEHRAEALVLRVEFESGVVVDAVLIRIQTSQYVDVRRQRDDVVRV